MDLNLCKRLKTRFEPTAAYQIAIKSQMHFPIRENGFRYELGVRALTVNEPLIESTAKYRDEVSLCRKMLEDERDLYWAESAGCHVAQTEAADHVISSATFLNPSGNTLLDEPVVPFGKNPLLSISRHVQEDLILLSDDEQAGFPIVAGSVCFPSGWSIVDKLGLPLNAVHQPVPGLNALLGHSIDKLLARLKPGRPVWRDNWGIRPSGQLDQSPRYSEVLATAAQSITTRDALQRCYFRVEKQTLSRLAKSRHILFTIHTSQCELQQLTAKQQQLLAATLKSMPDAIAEYKGIAPMIKAILASIDSACGKN